MPCKANEARRHKVPRARDKACSWPEHDRALQQRGSLTAWVTPEALAAWHPPHTGQRGRPRGYPGAAIETGHLLRLAFGRPWRQTEGLLRSIAALLGLTVRVLDRTASSRRSPGLAPAKTLAQAQASAASEVGAKLHLAVDPASGEILASELTGNDGGDASQAGPHDGEPASRAVAERQPGPWR